jgi:geranylgeranyl diphosphate synthase type II
MNLMTTENPLSEFQAMRTAVEAELDRITAGVDGCPERLTHAIRYSVLAPGKRMRPLLCMLACQAVGGDWSTAVPAAAAVELVHVYSLVHDDLPAMDDDALRRGRATCHIEFDEATAILAGDSLQMLAIELLCDSLPADQALECCRILSKAAGRSNLVGGQADDLAAEGRWDIPQPLPPLEFLQGIHRRKTSALIEASLQLGGVAGGATLDHLKRLAEYGRCIGLAFQIVDDCLDLESTPEQMGKMTGKDSAAGKLTYPGLLGLAESRKLAQQLIREACEQIAVFNEPGQPLARLAKFVVDRST